ncbi:hypothetical protein J1N35_022373 [Gossypium stocksii]|uniref:Uncharacterized protein n=1 Tax=Gossypium stocksii TaxID=47602 RepID=A0A9D4A2P8_9ROSI|nr:hypothetical protein J1N35_022373 [Gossypium stocksii]
MKAFPTYLAFNFEGSPLSLTENISKALAIEHNLWSRAFEVASPLNLSHVDFNYLKDISTDLVSFNIYHPEGEEWEAFKREWKYLDEFIIPTTPKAVDGVESSIEEDQHPEDPYPTEETLIEPIDQPNERHD